MKLNDVECFIDKINASNVALRILGQGTARCQRQDSNRSSPLGFDAVADRDAHSAGRSRSEKEATEVLPAPGVPK